jgi:hypothetical protein
MAGGIIKDYEFLWDQYYFPTATLWSNCQAGTVVATLKPTATSTEDCWCQISSLLAGRRTYRYKWDYWAVYGDVPIKQTVRYWQDLVVGQLSWTAYANNVIFQLSTPLRGIKNVLPAVCPFVTCLMQDFEDCDIRPIPGGCQTSGHCGYAKTSLTRTSRWWNARAERK